jgi:hypothetical protein
MILTNPNITGLSFGQMMTPYVPVFDPSNALQGLGCGGDDGTVGYIGLPAGLSFDPVNGEITGAPLLFGTFTATLEVVGTDEACENPVIYYSTTITFTIARPAFKLSKNWIAEATTVPTGGKLICTLLVEPTFMNTNFYALASFENYGTDNPLVYLTINNELDALLEAEKLKANNGVLQNVQDVILRQYKLNVVTKDSEGDTIGETTYGPGIVLLGWQNYESHQLQPQILDNIVLLGGWLAFSEPPIITISPTQPEYLFVLLGGGINEAVVTYDNDGTPDVHVQSGFGLRCINIGQYITPDTNTITVRMRRNGVFYGSTRTYVIDREHKERERFLMFRNNFGAIETIRCTGILSEEFEQGETTISERILRPDSHLTQGRLFAWKTSDTRRKRQLATGFVSKKYRKYLAEQLMQTNEVYEYDADNQRLIPVILANKKLESYQDREHLFGMIIDYYYPF